MTLNNRELSTDEVVLQGVISLIDRRPSQSWNGTMSTLQNALRRSTSVESRSALPRSPSALRVVLNRIVNRVRTRGISVKFSRTNTVRSVQFSR